MRICFERLCFATKRPAVDDRQSPQLDDIKTIDTFNLNVNSTINTSPITSITTTSPPTEQYSKYIKNNYKENYLNNNNKNHIYHNISLNSGTPQTPVNFSDINSQLQSKINNNKIINQSNERIINTNEESTKLDNQNKISEFLATTNSENSNPQITFAVIGDKVVNINNIDFTIATSSPIVATSSDATKNIVVNKVDRDQLDKMHKQEASNNSKCQLETGTTPVPIASVTDTGTVPPISLNNNQTIPADILHSSLIFGTDALNLNDPNLDIETINYIHKQQHQLQKLYQQQLQNQLQHIQQQAQTLFQPNIQFSEPSTDGRESVNSDRMGAVAPPPSSLPLPLTFQQHQQQNLISSNQQFSATQFDQFNNYANTKSNPIVTNPGISNEMEGLCINSVESISILPQNMVTNTNYIPSTPQEQQFIQMIQVKELKIQELQRVLQYKENEIAELKSHLDKFQSVFPFSRSSSGGGGSTNTTTTTGPVLRKTGQAFQRQRAQGISAEPQSESSVMELLHVTFPKYDKDER